MTYSYDLLVEKLIENENAIGRLYHQFSLTFVEENQFWSQLSQEEQKHSKWIKDLLEYVKKGEVKRGTTTLKIQAVETAIKYVDSVCEKCRNGKISKLNAYAIAYDLENSLLEKKFFSMFLLDVPIHKEVHDRLIYETEKHRKWVGDALNAMKSSKDST